jgi:methylmalonyl-CoA mutase
MASDREIFPRTSEGDWRRAAGREPPQLVTADGIALDPLHARRADMAPITTRPGWRIVQRLTAADADGAAREVASAIAGGATGIEIVFDTSAHPLRSRLPVAAAKRLAAGLPDFGAPDVTIRVDAGPATAEVAAAFADAAESAGTSLVMAHDPVAQFAATGEPGWSGLERGPDLAQAIAAAGRVDGARVIAIADGRLWHAAGASEVQELAAVLATQVAFLRVAGARGGFGVALAADTPLFATIAKFRAMRLLLQRLAEVVGAPDTIPIHGETAWRTRTRVEPRLNVLRGAVAAVGAIAGGADSLAVLPFDAGGANAQRLARNTQLIAGVEAHLARVADPAAGAGAIEAMTDAFATQAWASFQAIEAGGGITAPRALERLAQAVAKMRHGRSARVASGELPLIGVNVHVAEAVNSGAARVAPPRSLLRYETLDDSALELDEAER